MTKFGSHYLVVVIEVKILSTLNSQPKSRYNKQISFETIAIRVVMVIKIFLVTC